MNTVSNPALIPPSGLPPADAPAPAKQGARAPGGSEATAPGGGQSFAAALEDATDRSPVAGASAGGGQATTSSGLQFSRHALERAQRRGIDLGPTALARLNEGVGRAAGKGSRDSVVLVDGTAFVVSVSNRTVITAVGSEHMREHVFTNIDSAVIA